jgi:TetR/AcrR family transcriptional regulator
MARKPGRTREATRTAIIAAAEQVFANKGFAGASMSAIAKEAQVTKSLIHYHFSSKDALWQEIKETRFEEYATEQGGILDSSGPARDFIGESMGSYFAFLQENPHFLRLMWWSQAEHGQSQHPEHDLKVSQTMRTLVQGGIKHVHDLQARGEIRADIEPRFLFAAFLSLLRHWFVARRDFRLVEGVVDDAVVDAKYLDAIVSVFLDGVMPR